MTFEVKYDKIYNVKDRYLYKTEQKNNKNTVYYKEKKKNDTEKSGEVGEKEA